jgi:histidinol-phosphate aminotransferase
MQHFLNHYFPQRLTPPQGPDFVPEHLLHLNEMPLDVPEELKETIAERFKTVAFNRYPEPFAQSLVAQLATWYGCRPQELMVAPGSSAFIRLLLTFFGLNGCGQLVISRPSFAYYQQFCDSFHIPFTPWDLDENFQFVPSALDGLTKYSVVFLTTPNNPTGSQLSPATLRALLAKHPQSLFVVDEAYAEFVDETMLPLLKQFDNLVLLRTFSKAFCAAGVRCGVLLTNSALVSCLSGLQTPWQLSPFTIEAAKEILLYESETHWFKKQVLQIVAERDHLLEDCQESGSEHLSVFPSKANFLLIKSDTAQTHTRLLTECAQRKVLIKDLDGEPNLANCVRVTIGTPQANQLFASAFHKVAQGHT